MPQTAREEQRPATLEEIWAILEKSARLQEEANRRQEEADLRYERQRKEFERKREEDDRRRKAEKEEEDKRWKAQREEDERKHKESWDELRRMFAETDKRIGSMSNSFGEMVEHLVAPGIQKSLVDIGITFSEVSQNRRIFEDGQYLAEVDLLLENNKIIVAAEIKAKVRCDDIKEHRKRLEKMRGFYNRNGDKRKLYGAVAGVTFTEQQRAAAMKAGFYVIVQSGDTMKLDMPKGYKPQPIA